MWVHSSCLEASKQAPNQAAVAHLANLNLSFSPLQGTPLTPMDISPQPEATGSPSAPTPPPQPQFTPAWTKPPTVSGSFSFSSGMDRPTSERPTPRQSPRTRRQTSKPAADLPKSRFMPQDATDTTAASEPAFTAPGQNRPGSTSLDSNAPVFGVAGSSQPTSRDSESNATVFESAAQTQRSSAGSAGIGGSAGTAASAGVRASAGSAGVGGTASSAGTAGTPGIGASAGIGGSAGTAGTASAGQNPAQSTFPNAFASSSSQAAPSSFFPSAASISTASAFPFSVPGRLMDSRIKDACAMGFMGINLDSASGSTHDPSSSQMPSSGTAPSTTVSGSATAGWGSATAHPSASTGPPPPASSQFQSLPANAFQAGFASCDDNSSKSHQVPPGDPPPSPFSFNLGAEPTPKTKTGRAMFGAEHVATNLHDQLVLEEEGSAAAAEPTARSGTSSVSQMPPQAQHAASSDTLASGANDANSMPSGVDPGAAVGTAAAAQSASSCPQAFGAGLGSTAAAPAAARPSFVFGAKPAAAAAAASASQPNQAHTFSFGTAAGPSSFPPSNPAAHSGKPFVFGAKASAAAQATANGGFPPPGGSQAAAQEPAAQPASVNIAFPRPLGRAAAPSASATAQSMPVQFSAGQASSFAGLRNCLHSPSGIAKHTGPGRHGRAVPSSPGARRGVRVSPGKQLNGDDRPAGLPNQWTPAHPLADPTPGLQGWVSEATHSTHERAKSSAQQHQVMRTALMLLHNL